MLTIRLSVQARNRFPGAAGETTHQMEDTFGIPSIVMADGPGGIRVTQQFEATKLETGEENDGLSFLYRMAGRHTPCSVV